MDETITSSNLIFDQTRNLTSLSRLSISSSDNSENDDVSWGEEYAKLYEAPAEVIAILSIFYGTISIIAIIGNTLVIWIVATTRQMHTVTNLYIANLAFADVIIGMFCIPFQFQAALLQRWNLPDFMCAFCPFIQVLSVNVSVFTLTAIAVDRHRAIINPLRARPTRFFSKLIIVAIWIAAIAFSIPCAIAFRVIEITELHKENGIFQNVTRPFCENVNLTDEQLQSYRYYLVFVQYFVPLCVISTIYIQMAFKLWGSRTPGNAQDSRDVTLLRNKKKVIKMLIIVVVVFGVCWLPLQTYNILYVTWPHINEYRFINIIWFCCDWLAMSNSCYNPFIYGIYNEKFKREFNRRFTYCFCKFNSNDIPDRTFSVYTRASSIRSNYTNHNNSTRINRNTIILNHNNQNKCAPSIIRKYDENFLHNQQNGINDFTLNNIQIKCNNNDNNKSILLFENDDINKKIKYNKIEHDIELKILQNNHNHAAHVIQASNIYNTLEKDEWNHKNYHNHHVSDINDIHILETSKLDTLIKINKINSTNMELSKDISLSPSSSTSVHHCIKNDTLLEQRTIGEKNLVSIFKQNTNENLNNELVCKDSLKSTKLKLNMKHDECCNDVNLEMSEYPLLDKDHRNSNMNDLKYSVKFNNNS